MEQMSQAVFTHALHVPDSTRHEAEFHLQELCCLQDNSDLGGKVDTAKFH